MPVYTLTRRGGRTKRDPLFSLRAVRGLYVQAGSLQLPLFFKLLAIISPSGEPVVPVNKKTSTIPRTHRVLLGVTHLIPGLLFQSDPGHTKDLLVSNVTSITILHL